MFEREPFWIQPKTLFFPVFRSSSHCAALSLGYRYTAARAVTSCFHGCNSLDPPLWLSVQENVPKIIIEITQIKRFYFITNAAISCCNHFSMDCYKKSYTFYINFFVNLHLADYVLVLLLPHFFFFLPHLIFSF